MSNQTFDDLRDVAEELITEFGEEIDWVTVTNPVPETSSEPWKDEDVPSGADTSLEVVKKATMVFLNDDRDNRETRNLSRRSLVAKGNTLALLTKPGFEPALKDIVRRTSTSESYIVAVIDKIKPNADSAILYQIRLA